jgi:hypothetical protein
LSKYKQGTEVDWHLAIDKYRGALERIMVMLVAMVEVSGIRTATLPRHLHRFVLRLLRPAEAAARRLIIVAARGVEVTLPAPRQSRPNPQPMLRNGLGQLVPAPPQWRKPARPRVLAATRTLALPLLDPLKRFGRRKYVKRRDLPRITFDWDRPREPDPVPPTPGDPLDAGRIHRRLDAIGRVLDDLPRQAKRFARWQARRDSVLAQSRDNAIAGAPNGSSAAIGARRKPRSLRVSPMRPGRPPGWRRRPDHQVYEVLNELQGLAFWALERPDTS